jgi:TolB-like protein/thioredoxin-like negative regulator of GroEL
MLVAHATVAPEPIWKRAPNLDPALGELVMRLLEKRPGDRPQNATDVMATLDAIATGTAVRRGGSRRVMIAIASVLVFVAIAVSATWSISRSRAMLDTSADASGAAGASVAVLPFDNLSGDQQQQYFSDGMSEQIMYALGKVAGLRVSPRASAFAYRGRGAALREIGARLHVAHVIEGSVRQAGRRLRVNVQLVSVASGNADWSEEYQRNMSDVFEMQDDIARAIVGALRARLTAGATAPAASTGTRSVEAYTLYLKGRYFYEKRTERDLRQAEMFFREAIAKDPSYARAYAGLSATYAFLGISGFITRAAAAQPAKEAVDSALRLDSTSAEAYTSLGFVRLFYDWDCPGAQQALERAIKLDPQYAPARFWHAWYFVAVNQLDSALSEARRAAQIDPIANTVVVGRMLAEAGRHEEALEEFQKALAMDPTRVDFQARIATSSVMLGRCDEALRAVAKMHAIAYTFDGMTIGYVLAVCNRKDEARALAVDLESRASRTPAAAEELVSLYAGLGEKDKAFKWLERAYAERSGPLYKLRVEPTFVSLRSDPRFEAIVKRMHFP